MKSVFLLLSFLILAQSCRQSAPREEVTDLSKYDSVGSAIVKGAQTALGKKLVLALQDYGTEGAIGFCNANAIPITDSMSHVFNVSLKRVSDQPRNVNNQANESELEYIREMKQNLVEGKGPAPKVYELEGKVLGYYPIITNALCLQCHGVKDTDILPGTQTMLSKLYPMDKATGYTVDQLRGIWVVTMDKSK